MERKELMAVLKSGLHIQIVMERETMGVRLGNAI